MDQVARIEEEEIREVRITRIELRRPIVATRTRSVEARIVAVARSGQEERIVVLFARYLIAVHAVLGSPCPCAVACISKLILLCSGWHAPTATPINMGSIILWIKYSF